MVNRSGDRLEIRDARNAVGYYDLGNVYLHVNRRPSWLQLVVTRWLLGWTWHDTQPERREVLTPHWAFWA